MQERLASAIEGIDRVVINAARLIAGAHRLGVPVIMTEQYGKRLGRIVPELRARAPAGSVVDKVHFSALVEPACAERFAALGRGQVVVAGTETHVCVLQTTLALKEAGYEPYLVVDVASSGNAIDRETAVTRLRDAGVAIVTTEMVLFEWLARADPEAFSELLPLIKSQTLPTVAACRSRKSHPPEKSSEISPNDFARSSPHACTADVEKHVRTSGGEFGG